jgi:kynurenine formamidase
MPKRAPFFITDDEDIGTKGHGFLAHECRHVGQWGTHVDPPCHFVRGGRTLDEIPVEQMMSPLVLLNIEARAKDDPDTTACLADVEVGERRHGRIPRGSFVALSTGWSRRWPNQEAMMNRDANGLSHFPGWSMEVLRLLAEARHVVAIGHDVTDTDPGCVSGLGKSPLELYWLEQDRWQIELLANLHMLPEHGAVLIATWPKPRAGSGFPARCFAIAPTY